MKEQPVLLTTETSLQPYIMGIVFRLTGTEWLLIMKLPETPRSTYLDYGLPHSKKPWAYRMLLIV